MREEKEEYVKVFFWPQKFLKQQIQAKLSIIIEFWVNLRYFTDPPAELQTFASTHTHVDTLPPRNMLSLPPSWKLSRNSYRQGSGQQTKFIVNDIEKS